MIAQVIPLVKLRNNLDYFSYSIPSELEKVSTPGRLVRVNFRNQPVVGLIIGFEDPAAGQKFKLKDILGIVENCPMILPWQIDLMKYIAAHYLVSMAAVAVAALPEFPKRKSIIDAPLIIDEASKTRLDDKSGHSITLYKYRKLETKAAKIRELIGKGNAGNQVLIISPEIFSLKELAGALSDLKPVEYASETGIARNWNEWLAISTGKEKLIIGTRGAVFAPVNNLGLIIIDEEENENHKQSEPNPRYDCRMAAEFLAKHFNIPIYYFSRCPSIEILHRVAIKSVAYEELDSQLSWPKVNVVDMKSEHHYKNATPLSDYLRQQIVNLQQGQRLLIYLNKLGFSSGSICRDCGFELRNDRESQRLESIECNKCKGVNLFFTGQGIDKISDLIRREFPERKVGAYAADSSTTESFNPGDYDLIITTAYGITNLDLSKFTSVCSLSADLMMSKEDFRVNEQIFQVHYEIISRLNEDQEFIIQTRNPEHYIYTSLLNVNLKNFYLNEISDRRQYNLPPLSRLIKVVYKNKIQKAGQTEIDTIYSRVAKRIAGKFELRPPTRNQEISGQHVWRFTIKLPLEERIIGELDFLREEPVVIDVDPIRIS